MSSVQHTQGPWTWDDNAGDAGGLVIWSEHGDRVARVCWYGEASETPWATEANARLIAAAPELLDAMERLVLHLGWQYQNGMPGSVAGQVWDALAKARGRK